MKTTPTALERAFQLAASGRHDSVESIRKALTDEGLPRDQLTGPSLYRQLRELIRSSQGSRTPKSDGEKRSKLTAEELTARDLDRWNDEGGAAGASQEAHAS